MFRSSTWFATALVMVWSLGTLQASAEPRYTGVKDCSRCHKKELIGNQLAVWKKARHSTAFETLKSEQALEIARERGLAGPPHEADDCLRCHATGHGLEPSQIFKKKLLLTDSVQCESCHGPGSDYRKKKIMSDPEKATAAGMWDPGEDDTICTACHNSESPTWDEAEGFDIAAAREEIAHPIPEEVKGHYLELEKLERKKRKAAGRDGDDGDDDDDDDDDE